MNTQRIIGVLFLIIGIVIIASALAPVLQHPPQLPSMPFLVAGIIVAVLGALIVPSSGAGPAIQQLVVVAKDAPVLGALLGGRRASDPPVTPPTADQPPKAGG